MPIMWEQLLIGFGALIVITAWLQTFGRRGRAIGTISKIERDADDVEVPVISFQVGGHTYEFRPSLTLVVERKKKAIGRKLPVVYNPSDPSDADVGTPIRRYLPAAIVTVSYAVFMYWYYSAK